MVLTSPDATRAAVDALRSFRQITSVNQLGQVEVQQLVDYGIGCVSKITV